VSKTAPRVQWAGIPKARAGTMAVRSKLPKTMRDFMAHLSSGLFYAEAKVCLL
jgi:hypothetical protein